MEAVNYRAVKASVEFLRRNGYKVIDTNPYNGCINVVAEDEDNVLHMIYVYYDCGFNNLSDVSFSDSEIDFKRNRDMVEREAMFWMVENDDYFCELNTKIVFDIISIIEFSNQRAMLRHHINVLQSAEYLDY